MNPTKPIADVILSCGRCHLRVAGIVLVTEPEPILCLEALPFDLVADGGNYVEGLFRAKWTGTKLDWAARHINLEQDRGSLTVEVVPWQPTGFCLRIAGLNLTTTESACRDSNVPEHVREPIPEEELAVASIGGKPVKDMDRDVIRFFRPENWTEAGLNWVRDRIQSRI